MEHRQLGHNGPDVSIIGLGCNQLGLDATAAGRRADHRLLERAIELGINHFDTADSYTHGDSERVLGEFRRRHPDVLVATKVGYLYRPTSPIQRLAVADSPHRSARLTRAAAAAHCMGTAAQHPGLCTCLHRSSRR